MADFYRRWQHQAPFDLGEHMRHLNILIMGPPGSGKSTQAQRVSETFDLPLVSAGKLLRTARDVKTQHGSIREYLERGDLVPDAIVNRLIKFRLTELSEFVLEGYPRNRDQAEYVDDVVEFDRIIRLRVPEEVLKSRLTGRRVCQDCEAVYHVDFEPSDQQGVCDRCGGELVQRPDDSPKRVRHRIDVYRERTHPAIDYFSGRQSFVNLDGEGHPDDVWLRIQSVVKHIPEQTSVSL